MTTSSPPQSEVDLPRGACPIGPLALHTFNAERTECIWCGPGRLAAKPGRWVPVGEGMSAWSVEARS